MLLVAAGLRGHQPLKTEGGRTAFLRAHIQVAGAEMSVCDMRRKTRGATTYPSSRFVSVPSTSFFDHPRSNWQRRMPMSSSGTSIVRVHQAAVKTVIEPRNESFYGTASA